MAQLRQEPHYTCDGCGKRITADCVASYEYDYHRSTRRFPISVAICWGCFTGVEA